MKQSRHSSGKAKAPKALQQSVIVKVDLTKYRDFRSILAKHGVTVASFFRATIDDYVDRHSL